MKADLKKELPGYIARKGVFDVVALPPRQYLMCDGHGDPNTSDLYHQNVESLFSLAYAIKFLSKRELDRDYIVMPLEGLWWAEDYATFTTDLDKSQWIWTMMILTPDWIPVELVDRAREATFAKTGNPRLTGTRLGTLHECLCVQTLHLGSYSDEGPVLRHMHEVVIPELGYALSGRHHEIYLSDPRRTAPEKVRTILRQPVEPQNGADG